MTRPILPGLALLILLLTFSAACKNSELTSIQGVFTLQERTLPPGATIVSLTGPTQDQRGLDATWELETGMTWDTYKRWVLRELLKDFRPDSMAEPSVLLLRKSLPGDAITVMFQRLSNSPLRIRVTFSAIPD